MTAAGTSAAQRADPMMPSPRRVASVVEELASTWTLELVPPEGAPDGFAPGQFAMLYAFGVGEAPISVSGRSEAGGLLFTIRAVGAVTRAICAAGPGDMLGLRGPFGARWPVADAEGGDVIIVAGGLGLAPLRPAMRELLANRNRYGRVTLLYGARSPSDILFAEEVRRWRGRFDADVRATVDLASSGWAGEVGVVTGLIAGARFDPEQTTALVCGPEIMMRFTALELERQGVPDERIYVSLERNMQCAVAFCGHCQLGSELVCRDGPVVPYERVRALLGLREL